MYLQLNFSKLNIREKNINIKKNLENYYYNFNKGLKKGLNHFSLPNYFFFFWLS